MSTEITESRGGARDVSGVTDAGERAIRTLHRHVTGDRLDIVIDMSASAGCRLTDLRDGVRYLDFAGFYGSAALGHNHPGLVDGINVFTEELPNTAASKPSNPDFPTVTQARFAETFLRVLGDPELPYLFFVDGGALAVENALKVAFDWKTRRNAERGRAVAGWRVLHLEHAFHGRSGYTMSMTNTDPAKTEFFPTFDWPRIPSPAVNDTALWSSPGLLDEERLALGSAESMFLRHPHEIACFVAEPIQCEGGDRYLRREFLLAMQKLCERHDALFVLDEVQTGCGATGLPWAYEHLGLAPDLVSFGKKTQVCGVMGGRRVTDVPANALRAPSRLSSTWGGNLVDMLRATRILEIIESGDLVGNAAKTGEHLLRRLIECAAARPDLLSLPRGKGLLCCVDLADEALRDRVVTVARERYRTLFLGCGERTLRMRPPLTATEAEADEAVDVLSAAVADAAGPAHTADARTAAR